MPPPHRLPGDASPFPGQDPGVDEKRLRMLNAERQKSIISETNKLLKLAQELNRETAGGDAAPPAGDELRKLAEIEKLAHNVKEKMSYTIGGPSPINNGPYGVINR